MRVIITGGNGFVGRHLQRELAAAWPGAAIAVWDRPAVDITDPATYRDQLTAASPDWVVHLAALANVGASAQQRDQYFAVNVDGTRDVLESMRELAPNARALVV